MTGVRPYTPNDERAIREICYSTGFMGDSAERFWRDRESFADVWITPYLEHDPGSVLVATIDDVVVGYLTGGVDTAAAPRPETAIATRIITRGLIIRKGTAGYLWRALIDGIRDGRRGASDFHDERWPSHLHINLVPAARGSGLGRQLIEGWLERLRARGSPGCHLATLAENTRAIGFFRRMGFEPRGEPKLVAGLRSPKGERLHQQIMVRDV